MRDGLRNRLEKNRLQSVCIAGYTNFTADLEHGDIPHREIQIQHVTELARLAHDLGRQPGPRLHRLRDRLVELFGAMESGAGRVTGVCPPGRRVQCDDRGSEPSRHRRQLGGALELIRAVGEPNCKAMFDAWAPALHGDDLEDIGPRRWDRLPFTRRWRITARLRRFHYDPAVINYRPQVPAMQAVPIAEGFIDYREFLRSMRPGGFTGSVAYEICSPTRDGGSLEMLDRYAQLFLEFLDQVRREIGAEHDSEPQFLKTTDDRQDGRSPGRLKQHQATNRGVVIGQSPDQSPADGAR